MGFLFLASTPVAGLFIKAASFHVPEDSFFLELAFENLCCLGDIVVEYFDLHLSVGILSSLTRKLWVPFQIQNRNCRKEAAP